MRRRNLRIPRTKTITTILAIIRNYNRQALHKVKRLVVAARQIVTVGRMARVKVMVRTTVLMLLLG